MDDARQIVRDALADPQRELNAYQIASAYVGLGDEEEALLRAGGWPP
jgi:thioredoxin-like negative regulator of GroEL